nr:MULTISPECIES: hypothetical protein [Listeria]
MTFFIMFYGLEETLFSFFHFFIMDGTKYTGMAGGTLRASAYVESVKGTLNESGLMDVVMGLGLSTAAIRGSMTYEGASGLGKNIENANPSEIRFSQTSVNGSDEIIASMKANGWKGDPIDVVRMPDGSLTTLDNTRVAAAREVGIDVQANVRSYDTPLPDQATIDRFTTKKGVPKTWGEAIELRVGKQKADFRNNNPMGSFDLEKMK